jgi:diaminohydroxyphosphoribosylaminopyrimidine deaminase/5-amino-6-(5-phosphoribosylamino)uracil reductase
MKIHTMYSECDDKRFMRLALAYASRNYGQTSSNPSVGCVIVSGHKIVGVSATSAGGRPHAEVGALAQAGELARNSTAYVTLEPCSHFGKTSPCADALIDAGIKRVVVATRDPFPKVSGRGIEMLKAAGLHVTEAVCEQEARDSMRGFLKAQERGLPYVSMKIATSLDGKIALKDGSSQWITGERSRKHGHILRAKSDAIITGIGTVLSDNPTMNCRLPGLESASPVRVVLDSKLRIPLSSNLVATAKRWPLFVMTTSKDINKIKALEKAGVKICYISEQNNDHVNLISVMKILVKEGLFSVLIEAGEKLSTAMITSGLLDRIYWFQSSMILGSDAKSAIGKRGLICLAKEYQFQQEAHLRLGDDYMYTLQAS